MELVYYATKQQNKARLLQGDMEGSWIYLFPSPSPTHREFLYSQKRAAFSAARKYQLTPLL